MATSKPRLDRRIVRSRNAILSAFERLLMDKPLADITVSAIAREANVDRKTFYVHFGTVDGLLDAIAVDVVEMIVDSVEKTLASMDGDANERALGAAGTFFKTINEALCNNLVLNRQLIENIPLDDFMTRLRVPLEHEIAEIFKDVRKRPEREYWYSKPTRERTDIPPVKAPSELAQEAQKAEAPAAPATSAAPAASAPQAPTQPVQQAPQAPVAPEADPDAAPTVAMPPQQYPNYPVPPTTQNRPAAPGENNQNGAENERG